VLTRPVIGTEPNRRQLNTFEIKEPNGQILSYRTGTTDVAMRGTFRMPDARLKLKVESRPGFVELDINRGQIIGLKPAAQFGKDFLTYVLWAISVDGKAANLGEIPFLDGKPVSINVTTPYQTFWLMLTAEPHFAVVDPSPVVVLYSASDTLGKVPDRTAEVIPGKLVFHTHYGDYDNKPSPSETSPNPLLQARKAVELASKTPALAGGGAGEGEEEARARAAFKEAKNFLARAEAAYKENPVGSDVAQFARTSAQIAENARALALGAVGGAHVSGLEQEVKRLQAQVEQLRAQLSKVQLEVPPAITDLPAEPPRPAQPAPESPEPVVHLPPPPETSNYGIQELMAKPIAWFGLVGWIAAILLLFRRRTI
jgi:hypothetical protein